MLLPEPLGKTQTIPISAQNNATFCSQAFLKHPFANHTNISLTTIKQRNLLKKICTYIDDQNGSLLQTNAVKDMLIRYFFPFLILVGLSGNLVSLKVTFSRCRLKSEKHSLCLVILAATNTCIIILGPLREYVEYVYGLNVKSHSSLVCHLVVYTNYLCNTYAAYTLSFIAYERWQAIKCPFKYKLKRIQSTRNQLALILAFCAVVTMPYLYLARLVENKYDGGRVGGGGEANTGQMKCILDQFYFQLNIVDAVVFFAVPYTIIIVYSTLSFFRLLLNRFKIKNGKAKNDDDSGVIMMMIETTNRELLRGGREGDSVRSRGRRRPRRKITLVLLLLPNFYLLTNLPVFIVILLEIFIVSSNITKSVESSSNSGNALAQNLDGYDVAFHFARSLMYTNNCLNVLFFILLGDFLKMDFLKFF